MNKILTTRENKGLFYNSALKTRSYSDGKKSNSFPPNFFLVISLKLRRKKRKEDWGCFAGRMNAD